MRTLPDAPDLDALRRRAGDLLPHLRAARPESTLSDAHAAVAEQYGFRAWPDLEAEVARRSTAVRTAAEELTDAVAVAFGLGDPEAPLAALEQQWAGQAWVLVTGRGRFMVRQLVDWFDESAVENEVLLAESAAAAGITTLRPVRSPAGAVVETVDGSRWRAYGLPALGPEPSTPVDPDLAAAAGRILARVHNLRLPAPGPVSPWLTCVRTEAQWWHLQGAAGSAGAPWAPRLAEVIPAIVDVSGIVEPAGAAQPTVLSGCHYAPNAFRMVGTDDLAVITWEHAGAIPPRWDLGGMLAPWAEGVLGQVNAPAAEALVAGYAEEAELPGPLDLGIFSTHVCASLSWLASRIRIALVEPAAEQREAAGRAVPWLLAHLPSRAGLEAVLEAVGQDR